MNERALLLAALGCYVVCLAALGQLVPRFLAKLWRSSAGV